MALPSGLFSLLGVACVLMRKDILAVNPRGRAEGASRTRVWSQGHQVLALYRLYGLGHISYPLSLYFPVWKMWIVLDPTSQGYGEI